MIVVDTYIKTTQVVRNLPYCSQAHTANFDDVIEILAPILLMRILKHASPIHTARLTRPFFLSEYKRKKVVCIVRLSRIR